MTSTLVLHPNTLVEMAGPLGLAVAVMDAVKVGEATFVGELVKVAVAVEVAMMGVGDALATPITTGVAVNIEGVCVIGKNGVGPCGGWTTQPPQADMRNTNRNTGMSFFIFSPLVLLYPACLVEQSPQLV